MIERSITACCMAGSTSGQDEANPVFFFTRAKKTGLSGVISCLFLFISFDSLPALISQAICEQSIFVRFICFNLIQFNLYLMKINKL